MKYVLAIMFFAAWIAGGALITAMFEMRPPGIAPVIALACITTMWAVFPVFVGLMLGRFSKK